MNETDMRRLLDRAAKDAGSQSALARKWGHSVSYINQMLRGSRNITDDIARRLGYTRVDRGPVFRRLED